MWSHPTWCLLVALSTLVTGSKVPRQIVYQIRPAPTSAFTTQDGTFYLDDGVTGYQFPTFGLKAPESKAFRTHSASVLGLAGNNESGDVDSSSSSSSSSSGSSSPSEESSSAATREEITDVPTFGSHLRSVGHPQILQLQPEQIQQIFNSYKPQVQQIQQQQPQQQQDEQKEQENIDVGPRYEYKSIEESANSSSDDIKVAQTEAITEEKLQSAYSERREKRRRKQQDDPPGDASYAFGYETDESARHEVADPDGTVKGWYTYVDPEGITRKIIYSAGAGKGFVVLGKEKIKGPGTASPPRPPQQQQRRKQNKPNNRVNTEYGYAADSSTISSLKQQKPPSTPSSFSNYFNNWSDLGKAETAIPPQPTVLATVDTPTRTKKPVFIVKIRRPVNKDQYDDDESGYDGSSSQGSSASSSGEYETEHDSGEYNSGKGANYGGGGGGTGGGGLPVKSDPDASYVFGYETTDSNRLEKADKYGNVRGSYSYIDSDGQKRTVQYEAGSQGFKIIHASPSISRGVRLEAPPGYVVKRVPSLRTSESRYPIPISVPRPSAIVYHIHPDSGWKPWEPTLRKKKVKIHRKKLPKEFFQNARRDGIVLLQTQAFPYQKVTHFSTGEATSSGSMGAGSNNMYFKEKVTAAGTGTVTATETQVPYVPMSPPVSRRRHAPQRGYTADHHTYQIDDYGSQENTAATTYQQQQHSKSKQTSSSASSQSAPSSSLSAGTSEAPGPGLYSPAPFESMRESVDNRRSPTPNPVQLQSTQVAIKSRGAPTQTAAGLDTSSSNHHAVAFTSDGKLQVDVPTVIIEAIEAKSSASLVAKKDESNKSVIHHKLPEAAALTQSSSPVDLAVSSTSNLIKGSTPTSRPSAFELVSASSVNYQPSSVSAPTPPAASAPSIFNSQKSYSPSIASNNNVIHHHHQKQSSSTSSSSLSSSSSSSVASTTTPPSRSRRRHHRSKTASSTTPTSPSSTHSASSNSIKAVVGGNQETSTTMSSSKRLINRLAATEHEATVAA